MPLDGAYLNCVDATGASVAHAAKGRKFTVGSYLGSDLVLVGADRLHCEILCDAFGRVSIYNHSCTEPIQLNDHIVRAKRPLLDGARIKILNEIYTWNFPKSDEVATPERPPPEPAPNSSPLRGPRKRCQFDTRLTLHNFRYSINSDDEGNTSIESRQLDTSSSSNAESADAATTQPKSSITPPPNELDETLPKVDLLEATRDKENTNTHINKSMLQLCARSDVVITSFSPRQTGVKTEKSFTCVIKSNIGIGLSSPMATPGSVYNTPKSVLSELNEDSCSRDLMEFSTPSTSNKATVGNQQSSMHLIDLTTPQRLRPTLSATPKHMLSGSDVICMDSTSDSSDVSPNVIDITTPTTPSQPKQCTTLKTPKKQPLAAASTPMRTPQSLMKRAILTSAQKQLSIPKTTGPTPNRKSLLEVRRQCLTAPRRLPFHPHPQWRTPGRRLLPALPKLGANTAPRKRQSTSLGSPRDNKISTLRKSLAAAAKSSPTIGMSNKLVAKACRALNSPKKGSPKRIASPKIQTPNFAPNEASTPDRADSPSSAELSRTFTIEDDEPSPTVPAIKTATDLATDERTHVLNILEQSLSDELHKSLCVDHKKIKENQLSVINMTANPMVLQITDIPSSKHKMEQLGNSSTEISKESQILLNNSGAKNTSTTIPVESELCTENESSDNTNVSNKETLDSIFNAIVSKEKSNLHLSTSNISNNSLTTIPVESELCTKNEISDSTNVSNKETLDSTFDANVSKEKNNLHLSTLNISNNTKNQSIEETEEQTSTVLPGSANLNINENCITPDVKNNISIEDNDTIEINESRPNLKVGSTASHADSDTVNVIEDDICEEVPTTTATYQEDAVVVTEDLVEDTICDEVPNIEDDNRKASLNADPGIQDDNDHVEVLVAKRGEASMPRRSSRRMSTDQNTVGLTPRRSTRRASTEASVKLEQAAKPTRRASCSETVESQQDALLLLTPKRKRRLTEDVLTPTRKSQRLFGNTPKKALKVDDSVGDMGVIVEEDAPQAEANKSTAVEDEDYGAELPILESTEPDKIDYLGMRELLKTPKSCSTPRFKGLRELMQTPKVHASPNLDNIEELLEADSNDATTPKRHVTVSRTTLEITQSELAGDAQDKYFKTPRGKNLMIPNEPASAILKTRDNSIATTTEYDLNSTNATLHLDKIFDDVLAANAMDSAAIAIDDSETEMNETAASTTSAAIMDPLSTTTASTGAHSDTVKSEVMIDLRASESSHKDPLTSTAFKPGNITDLNLSKLNDESYEERPKSPSICEVSGIQMLDQTTDSMFSEPLVITGVDSVDVTVNETKAAAAVNLTNQQTRTNETLSEAFDSESMVGLAEPLLVSDDEEVEEIASNSEKLMKKPNTKLSSSLDKALTSEVNIDLSTTSDGEVKDKSDLDGSHEAAVEDPSTPQNKTEELASPHQEKDDSRTDTSTVEQIPIQSLNDVQIELDLETSSAVTEKSSASYVLEAESVYFPIDESEIEVNQSNAGLQCADSFADKSINEITKDGSIIELNESNAIENINDLLEESNKSALKADINDEKLDDTIESIVAPAQELSNAAANETESVMNTAAPQIEQVEKEDSNSTATKEQITSNEKAEQLEINDSQVQVAIVDDSIQNLDVADVSNRVESVIIEENSDLAQISTNDNLEKQDPEVISTNAGREDSSDVKELQQSKITDSSIGDVNSTKIASSQLESEELNGSNVLDTIASSIQSQEDVEAIKIASDDIPSQIETTNESHSGLSIDASIESDAPTTKEAAEDQMTLCDKESIEHNEVETVFKPEEITRESTRQSEVKDESKEKVDDKSEAITPKSGNELSSEVIDNSKVDNNSESTSNIDSIIDLDASDIENEVECENTSIILKQPTQVKIDIESEVPNGSESLTKPIATDTSEVEETKQSEQETEIISDKEISFDEKDLGEVSPANRSTSEPSTSGSSAESSESSETEGSSQCKEQVKNISTQGVPLTENQLSEDLNVSENVLEASVVIESSQQVNLKADKAPETLAETSTTKSDDTKKSEADSEITNVHELPTQLNTSGIAETEPPQERLDEPECDPEVKDTPKSQLGNDVTKDSIIDLNAANVVDPDKSDDKVSEELPETRVTRVITDAKDIDKSKADVSATNEIIIELDDSDDEEMRNAESSEVVSELTSRIFDIPNDTEFETSGTSTDEDELIESGTKEESKLKFSQANISKTRIWPVSETIDLDTSSTDSSNDQQSDDLATPVNDSLLAEVPPASSNGVKNNRDTSSEILNLSVEAATIKELSVPADTIDHKSELNVSQIEDSQIKERLSVDTQQIEEKDNSLPNVQKSSNIEEQTEDNEETAPQDLSLNKENLNSSAIDDKQNVESTPETVVFKNNSIESNIEQKSTGVNQTEDSVPINQSSTAERAQTEAIHDSIEDTVEVVNATSVKSIDLTTDKQADSNPEHKIISESKTQEILTSEHLSSTLNKETRRSHTPSKQIVTEPEKEVLEPESNLKNMSELSSSDEPMAKSLENANETEEKEHLDAASNIDEMLSVEKPKRRGRKPSKDVSTEMSIEKPKRRGRKPTVDIEETETQVDTKEDILITSTKALESDDKGSEPIKEKPKRRARKATPEVADSVVPANLPNQKSTRTRKASTDIADSSLQTSKEPLDKIEESLEPEEKKLRLEEPDDTDANLKQHESYSTVNVQVSVTTSAQEIVDLTGREKTGTRRGHKAAPVSGAPSVQPVEEPVQPSAEHKVQRRGRRHSISMEVDDKVTTPPSLPAQDATETPSEKPATRRGRRPTPDVSLQTVNESNEPNIEVKAKRRGRKKSISTENVKEATTPLLAEATEASATSEKSTTRRGRKATTDNDLPPAESVEGSIEPNAVNKVQRRGRKRSLSVEVVETAEAPEQPSTTRAKSVTRRGRKATADEATSATVQAVEDPVSAEVIVEPIMASVQNADTRAKSVTRRGRKATVDDVSALQPSSHVKQRGRKVTTDDGVIVVQPVEAAELRPKRRGRKASAEVQSLEIVTSDVEPLVDKTPNRRLRKPSANVETTAEEPSRPKKTTTRRGRKASLSAPVDELGKLLDIPNLLTQAIESATVVSIATVSPKPMLISSEDEVTPRRREGRNLPRKNYDETSDEDNLGSSRKARKPANSKVAAAAPDKPAEVIEQPFPKPSTPVPVRIVETAEISTPTEQTAAAPEPTTSNKREGRNVPRKNYNESWDDEKPATSRGRRVRQATVKALDLVLDAETKSTPKRRKGKTTPAPVTDVENPAEKDIVGDEGVPPVSKARGGAARRKVHIADADVVPESLPISNKRGVRQPKENKTDETDDSEEKPSKRNVRKTKAVDTESLEQPATKKARGGARAKTPAVVEPENDHHMGESIEVPATKRAAPARARGGRVAKAEPDEPETVQGTLPVTATRTGRGRKVHFEATEETPAATEAQSGVTEAPKRATRTRRK